ncbi:MAG TPA: DUF1552 domain-containing protein, partial [Pirellulales bacterium]|nr:DUF1552 domain-containing protein [Pirellulales bacterium]
VSWRTEATPSSKEINPRLVFERLFSSGDQLARGESQDKRRRYRQSILDMVSEDAARLRSRVGGADRQKLDEYLSGVRELELRVARAGEHAAQEPAAQEPEGFVRPEGIPSDYREHIRLMCDLMVLAFQSDLTRVCTFMLANEGSNRSYPLIGISDGHHELSHHGGSREKQAKIAQINRFHIEQFAYLLERLKATREGEGTLLDQSMIVYGSGIGDGDRHNHDNLPILFAGRGGGAIQTGRHLRFRKTPLNNLYLSMLDRVDAGVAQLGDSTGRLPRLSQDDA